MTRALVLLLAILPGCSAPRDPQAHVVVVHDGSSWYGPTCRVARARARWHVDPSWRRPAHVRYLGYSLR